MNIGEGISGAIFSDNQRFRYALWRVWERTGDYILFTGLNPSKAGVSRNDPTAVRMINFAKSWGFGGLFMGNLSAFITPDPKKLWPYLEDSKSTNDQAIKRMRELCTLAVVGWGDFGKTAGTRPAEVLKLIGEPVYCIKVNRSGEPSHPLYLPGNSKLIRYYRKEENHDEKIS